MISLKGYSSPYVFHAWIASAMIPPEILTGILNRFPEPEQFYDAFMAKDADALSMIPRHCLQRLSELSARDSLSVLDRGLKTHGISAFTFHDAVYPENLKNIPDSPAVLFYLGNVNCLENRSLAVVGSRAASYSGQKATRKLTGELSRNGISIISGLACGIDASAHRGCIEGGSPTIAILGCGPERIYPAANADLRKDLLDHGGLLLSEYPPGEKPAGWHFPVRNRILSGLAKALILMEAKIRSGSMTTVRHALDQGKDVFVYPGDPASPLYEGNHQLLREGAIYFTCAEDILEDLGWLDNQPIVGQNIDCSSDLSRFSRAESIVIAALRPGSLSFEQLSAQTGLSTSELMSTISLLLIKGEIESLPGKFYQIKA